MPLHIIRQNITRMLVDAIVNTTNQNMMPGGGVDAAIHRVAGPELMEHCKGLGKISVGEARITPAFNLPCKYIIHTVGPEWKGGLAGERVLLQSCYSECMRLAIENNLESIAFPLISSGAYGYPKDKVLLEAEEVITQVLEHHEMDVYLVVYDKASYSISREIYNNVQTYIDNFYIIPPPVAERSIYDLSRNSDFELAMFCKRPPESDQVHQRAKRDISSEFNRRDTSRERLTAASDLESVRSSSALNSATLMDMIEDIDKSFADTLLDYIDKKGMTDVEAYKGANVSRKVFSKLRCEKNYRPSKITAISYAISLHLSVEEAKHLLLTAGYALSRSYLMDVIIEYFLASGAYKDIHEVNQVLYQFDQPSLGCSK